MSKIAIQIGGLRRRLSSTGSSLAITLALALLLAAPAGAAEFGFTSQGLVATATNRDGTPDTQAGSHPYDLATQIEVNSELVEEILPVVGQKLTIPLPAGGNVKDIEVNLPPGLVGDPGATPQCQLQQFREKTGFFGLIGEKCPSDSQIGMTDLKFSAGQAGELEPTTFTPVYNLVPPKGVPAEFGFTVLSVPVVLVPHVRTGGDDGVSVRFTSLPQGLSLLRGKVTLWGNPSDSGHDPEREPCWNGGAEKPSQAGWFGGSGYYEGFPAIAGLAAEERCSFTAPARPFLSLPTSCTGALKVTATIDSWSAPGVFKEDENSMPGMTGCDKLDFAPRVVAQPEPAQADSPSGLSVEIQVPQTYDNAVGLAESNLKDTTVTLPAGVAVNPAAADGLAACSEEQFGLHTAAEVACPEASKLGQVEVRTPLLEHPLTGGVFLAQQGNLPGNGSNPFGSLLALYIQLQDPYSGVLVKLAGEVKPDPATGQLVTTFLNNPQVPFDSLKLSFFGGPRAALVNPPLCGTYTTETEMTPWSGGAAATPSWSFPIASGPGGSPCVTSEPFNPGLVSGTTSNQAGGFTPFSLTFDRSDGEQNMSRIQVTTPPGLLGSLAGVALCGEPQASQGACGPESLIGHVTVAVGAGSNPFYVTGSIYLTGSYNGAPYGIAFVVPAVAGPLNLGTVIVRAAVSVDPHTAALTVTSEPLPQIIEGVPLHIRAVNVTLDRERFIFNPTNCNPATIQAHMTSALGASSAVSTHFQATNCAALAFHPKFSVTTSGKTSRANGASLDARLVESGAGGQPILATNGGQANIARVKVELPKALPSRLTTLQKACTAQVFEVNPANCPAASRVGYAKATTPILPVALMGPAYFVSHGGEAFPSLIVVLQGYGVRVDLVGATFISKQGITSSTFGAVPDVPVTSFELYLPEGPYSALAANGNLCQKELKMPTEMLAQDGTVIHQSTPIGITGCKKTKSKARKASRTKKRRAEGAAARSTAASGRRSQEASTGSAGTMRRDGRSR
jgi:hypothetical protein